MRVLIFIIRFVLRRVIGLAIGVVIWIIFGRSPAGRRVKLALGLARRVGRL